MWDKTSIRTVPDLDYLDPADGGSKILHIGNYINHLTGQHNAKDFIFFNTSNLTYAYTVLVGSFRLVTKWGMGVYYVSMTDVGRRQQANRSGDGRSSSVLARSLGGKLKM
jgi:hypothetical protein